MYLLFWSLFCSCYFNGCYQVIFFACDLFFDDAVKIKKTQHRYAELKIT